MTSGNNYSTPDQLLSLLRTVRHGVQSAPDDWWDNSSFRSEARFLAAEVAAKCEAVTGDLFPHDES